jgi:Na+-driven multidrug efflux pump
MAYLLAHFIGESAIWWSIPAGWLIGTAVAMLRIRSGKWMKKGIVKK